VLTVQLSWHCSWERRKPAPAPAAAVELPASEVACFSQEGHSLQLPVLLPAVFEAPGSAAAGPLEGVKLEQAPLRPPTAAAEADAQCAPATGALTGSPSAGSLLSPLMLTAADARLGSQEEESLNVSLHLKIPPQLDPDQLYEFYKSILESQGVGPSQFLGADVKPIVVGDVSEESGAAQGGEDGDALALLGESVGREMCWQQRRGARWLPRTLHAPSPVLTLPSLPQRPCKVCSDILPTQTLGVGCAPHWSADAATAKDPQELGAEHSIMADSSALRGRS